MARYIETISNNKKINTRNPFRSNQKSKRPGILKVIKKKVRAIFRLLIYLNEYDVAFALDDAKLTCVKSY